MKIKPLEYELSENTLKSVDNVTDENAVLDITQDRKKNRGNTYLLINKDTSKLSYIVPIEHSKKFYGGIIPKPSSLFLGQSIEFEKKASDYFNSFPKSVEWTLHQRPNKEDNPIDRNIYLVKEEIYYKFLMYKISSITALISTVECFINEIIPENFTIENKKKEIVGKEIIERHWNLKSKLKTIVPKIKIISDLKDYEIKTNRFLELSKIRNEFTHMKTKLDGKNMDPFLDYFEQLINLDLKQKITETKNLIKLIEPKYV
jgi:hypothetical protein